MKKESDQAEIASKRLKMLICPVLQTQFDRPFSNVLRRKELMDYVFVLSLL